MYIFYYKYVPLYVYDLLLTCPSVCICSTINISLYLHWICSSVWFNPPYNMNEENNRRKKSNKRKKRNVLWFNPPYNMNVKTNIGKEFLKLRDECFPPSHPLQKILNRRTVKISYSTTPNIQKIISGQNSKKLTEKETQTRTCNCTKNNTCPLNGECLKNNLVYHAKVTTSDQKSNSYIGMTSTEFKDRLATHKHTFKYINSTGHTALSKHILGIVGMGIPRGVMWVS